MRQIGFAILAGILLAAALEEPVAASEVTALKILEKSFDDQTGQLSYELWNESDRTITAWRLSLARSDAHGHGQRSILDQDFYDRQPTLELRGKAGPIAPGGSVEARWRLDLGDQDAGSTALSLKVAAVVFEDLSWEGEPDAAATLLAARRARVEEIGRVLTEVEEQERRAWSSQEWSAALRQGAERLELLGADPDSSGGGQREVAAVLAATRLELARWLEDAGREVSLSPDPHQALRFLVRGLRDRYDSGLRATRKEDQSVLSVESEEGGER